MFAILKDDILITASVITSLTTIIVALKFLYNLAVRRNNGIKCLLRSNIIGQCSSILEKGYITVNELSCLDEATESYYNLGGNGFIKDLVAKVKALEVRQ